MPSTYAHYRMGQEVRSEVGNYEKSIIGAYPELFLLGLHGPDILFYYKPLASNPVNQTGYGTHGRTGCEFFENAAKVIQKQKRQTAYLSYVYGFICHFALDVTCHGYIDEKIAMSGISHAEIEVEFDRELMVKDGIDPIRHSLTDHIVPSMENAEVISEFFEAISAQEVHKALKGMIFNNNLLLAPSKLKRSLVDLLLKLSGNYKEMHGLMVNYQKNPQCEDSCRQLELLYQKARRLAVQLIEEYGDYMKRKAPLNDIYNYTFGTQLLEGEVCINEV